MLYFIKVVHILYILHFFAFFASKLIKKRRALSFAGAPRLNKAIASAQVHRIGTLRGKTSQVVTHNPPLSGKTSQPPRFVWKTMVSMLFLIVRPNISLLWS